MERDFERTWLDKLSSGIAAQASAKVRNAVMEGSDGLTSGSPRAEVIAWTDGAMHRLEERTGADAARCILAGCACHCPQESLAKAKRRFAETGSVAAAHAALQEQFVAFLRTVLDLDELTIGEVLDRGWGMAGVLNGNTIVAAKIPKSGSLVAYLSEEDPRKRREMYCHCPRVREAAGTPGAIPVTYCSCGAGYYKDMWERIIGRPVQVKLLRSVLAGDEVCSVEILLPA